MSSALHAMQHSVCCRVSMAFFFCGSRRMQRAPTHHEVERAKELLRHFQSALFQKRCDVLVMKTSTKKASREQLTEAEEESTDCGNLKKGDTEKTNFSKDFAAGVSSRRDRHDQLEIHRCNYVEHRVQQPEREEKRPDARVGGIRFGGA